MDGADTIFRKSSLDRVRTPEQLNEAVKGTGAGFTVLLIALVALVAGLAVWGIFGTIEETSAVTGVVSGKSVLVSIPANRVSGIVSGIDARIQNGEKVIQGQLSDLKQSTDGFTAVVTYEGNLTDGAAVSVTLVKNAYPPYKLIWR